jgi:plastocyanin
MVIKKTGTLLVVISAIIPHVVSANIILTEIMYDPPGADTGREWIEVYNNADSPIDLATLRFFENNVAHTMKTYNAPAALLLANTHAIIADNPDKFLIDYPMYAGLLIDSAFSLNNTGEPLSIQTSDAVVQSTVTYSVEWGAAGTGNSLQLSDGLWIPAAPTIGAINATVSIDESINEDSDTGGTSSSATTTTSTTNSNSTNTSGSSSNTTSSHNAQVPISSYKPKVKFEVSVGRDRYGFVNTPLTFVPAHNQDKNSGMKFSWTSGDGDYNTGKQFEHTYRYEGEYNLVLNASYHGMQSVSRNKIFIRTPDMKANIITRGKLVDIMLVNGGKFEVNVGGFEVHISDHERTRIFELPPDTIVNGGQTITIPSDISRLEADGGLFTAKILYPNGEVLYDVPPINITQQQN